MAQQTIPANDTTTSSHVGTTPSTGPFAVDFPFFSLNDVVVTRLADGLNPDATVTLVRGADYSLTGVSTDDGSFSSGTVTLTLAVSNSTITRYRTTPVERLSNFPLQGFFSRLSLNAELNKITAVLQENQREGGENDSELAAIEIALAGITNLHVGSTPPASPVANMFWWSSDLGELFIWYNDGNTTQWVPASATASITNSPTNTTPPIGGFFEDTTANTTIYRFRDRVMVGDSVLYTGNRLGANNYGTSWISQNAASYFIKNAFTSISTETGNAGIAILGASRTAPGVTPTLTHAGIAGISLNEGTGTFGRAIYAEAMHKSTTGGSSGIEIQVGNYTATAPIANAYSMGSSTVNGLSIGVEGGTGYTVTNADTPITPPTLPAGTAIDIAGGSLLASYQKWTTGIVFRNGALVRDGSNFAIAISLAQQHKLQWEATSVLHGASIWSEVTDGTQQVGLRFQNRHAQLVGANDRLIVDATDDIAGAGAVNWLGLRNARTGISPAVIATGSDTNVGLEIQAQAIGATRFTSHAGTGENLRVQPPASAPVDYLIIGGTASGGLVNISTAGTSTNIDLNITPKGTGVLRFGTLTATGDVAITGSIQIRDSGGTFRKLAVIA